MTCGQLRNACRLFIGTSVQQRYCPQWHLVALENSKPKYRCHRSHKVVNAASESSTFKLKHPISQESTTANVKAETLNHLFSTVMPSLLFLFPGSLWIPEPEEIMADHVVRRGRTWWSMPDMETVTRFQLLEVRVWWSLYSIWWQCVCENGCWFCSFLGLANHVAIFISDLRHGLLWKLTASRAGVLNRWGTPAQAGSSPYAFYNMESLISQFTNKCICFSNLFRVSRDLKQRTFT